MGRLFWKFFIPIWIAQLIGTMSVMFIIEFTEKTLDRDRANSVHSVSADIRHVASGDNTGHFPVAEARGHPVQTDRVRPMPPHGFRILPYEPLIAHLLASVIVAIFLTQYLSRPIRSLRAAFREAASGNLQSGVSAGIKKRSDELTDLLREYDKMAAQLKTVMDGQRQLLHDVSHELRSPLARMQAAMGLVRRQPEKISHFFDRLDSEIIRIDRLIGELLTLSRLDTNIAINTEESIEIGDILAPLVDCMQFEAQTKGKSVRYVEPPTAFLQCNPDLLTRAVENVVRNAILHTPPDTMVDIEITVDQANFLRISVKDNGSGIPQEELDSVFLPFYRGSDAEGKSEGHGLGLAITKRIIAAHGGTISAANLPAGGLHVEIALPALCSGSTALRRHTG